MKAIIINDHQTAKSHLILFLIPGTKMQLVIEQSVLVPSKYLSNPLSSIQLP
jgi:hypothetical protein